MESIINDLKSALDKMNEKTILAEKRSKEAVDIVNKYDLLLSDLDKRMKVVIEKENKYKEYENIDAAKASISKSNADIKIEFSNIAKEKKNLSDAKLALDEKEKELNNKIKLYMKKNESCDKMILQLENDRKEMRKKIIDQFAENLTKG